MKRRKFFQGFMYGGIGVGTATRFTLNANAQPESQGIDFFEKRVIQAVGIGAPNPNLPIAAQRAGALTAAKLNALRNLLQMVKGINLTSTTTIENSMTTSDVIQTKIQGVVKNFEIVGNPRYMSDQSVELTIQIPIDSALADTVLPSEMGTKMYAGGPLRVCPTCGQAWPENMSVPNNIKSQVERTGQGVYTGLIINAAGLGVMPAMAPQIIGADGKVVYGADYVEREYAVKMGVVGYAKNFEQARKNERIGSNPLVLKATKTQGQNRADVVLSGNDARLLVNAASKMNFLKQCRVLFII